MATLSGARAVCASTFLFILAACSNGRGSVQEGSEAQPPAPAQFTVGASVSGLEGSGLVLQNNGGDDLGISADGAVTFAIPLDEGATYNVTVLIQPSNPEQNCTVTNGTGTIAGANIANVTVTCETVDVDVPTFSVRGRVEGLSGAGLVLQNNRGDDLEIDQAGEFAFATPLATDAAYRVTVLTQPVTPPQTCTVTNGAGTVGSTDVTNVVVTCAAETFALGGRVHGLLGSGFEIQNEGGAPLAIEADGAFAFPERIAAGSAYSVTVTRQPSEPVQSCAIENATGTVTDRDVTSVIITCSTNRYTIGGTITGLAGSGLRLAAAGAGPYTATTSGAFQFPTAVASGTSYTVVVEAQPNDPRQTCVVANGAGVVEDANVTDVEISCTTERFSVGGRVRGLEGSGLVLQNNGADDLAIASDGMFTFSTEQDSGSTYEVTVATQPTDPSQICSIERGTGTVGGSDVTRVRVNCALETFSIGGSVTGLLGSGLVLENNGGDPVEVESDGGFRFAREIASGAPYHVTVRTEPADPVQSCTIANASGTVGTADIDTIAVSCTTSSFSLGGTISGLAGSGLTITNGTEQLALAADGSFKFATALPSGTSYEVAIVTQPSSPTQTCSVTNGSGIVGGSNIEDVTISCTTTEFTVGGTVSGLSGTGLRLLNNGADPIDIASNGSFRFPASLTAGSSYDVTVENQPRDPTQRCVVAQGVGTVSADVTDVSVECTTSTFTIGGTVTGLTGGIGPLVLHNGSDTVTLLSSGAFTFGREVPSGGTYDVAVISEPINRDCEVVNGQGTVTDAAIGDVSVVCNPAPIF